MKEPWSRKAHFLNTRLQGLFFCLFTSFYFSARNAGPMKNW